MNETQKHFCQAIQERRQSLRSLTDSFHQALEIAGLNRSKEFHSQTLNEIIDAALVLVEEDGYRKELLGLEPAYHNRQHFGDTCLALGYFLREVGQLSERQKLLLMLTMLVHDFGHQGIANLKPNFSQEKETIRLLRSSTVGSLKKNDLDLLTDLILGTSPQYLESTNALYINEPKNVRYFMQSLINDADIAASFIHQLTPSLTKLILIESGNPKPTNQEIDLGVKLFRENFSITTGVAKTFFLKF